MSKERETDTDAELESQEGGLEQADDGIEVERQGEDVIVKEPTESRRERRERERREERQREMDERINPLKETLSNLENMLRNQMRQPIPQLQSQRREERAEEDEDPGAIYDKMVDIQAQIQDADPGKQRELAKQYRELSLKMSEVQARRVVAQQMKTVPHPQPRQQQFDPVAAAEQVELNRQYPDVLANEKAVTYAKILFDAERAAGNVNRSNALEVQMQCCEKAAKQFKLRGGPAPTPAQRSRFGGGSSSPAVTGGGGVKLSQRSIDLAISANPHLPEKQAIAKWVKDMKANGLTEADLT